VAENDCGYIRKIEKKNVGVLNRHLAPRGMPIMVFSHPSSGVIQFKATLSFPEKVSVRIFNQRGQTVDVPAQCNRTASAKEIQWQSKKLPCGIYAIILQSGKISVSQKCAVLY
jgi:hypothetical protein